MLFSFHTVFFFFLLAKVKTYFWHVVNVDMFRKTKNKKKHKWMHLAIYWFIAFLQLSWNYLRVLDFSHTYLCVFFVYCSHRCDYQYTNNMVLGVNDKSFNLKPLRCILMHYLFYYLRIRHKKGSMKDNNREINSLKCSTVRFLFLIAMLLLLLLLLYLLLLYYNAFQFVVLNNYAK